MTTTATGLRRLRRTALLARLAALVVAVAVLWPLGSVGRLGQGLALVPTVFAVVLITATLVGELVSWRDARGRSASLEVRRVRDYLSVPGTIAVSVGLVLLIVVTAWATAVAVPDDLGRAGRSFGYRCVGDSGCDSGSFGPFPGSFYTVPIIVGLAGLVGLAALTLLVAVRRPRNGADPAVRQVDEQIRRSSVRTVVAAVGLAAAGSLAGVGTAAANGLLAHWSEVAVGLRVAGVLVQSAGLAGLALLVWSVAALLLPLFDRPRIADSGRFRPVRTPR